MVGMAVFPVWWVLCKSQRFGPDSWVPSLSSETLWPWADLKKALAEQPEGVKMLAQAFPGSEATSRWSQALEGLEQRSRPYLQDVQRYETYRWAVL